MSLDTYDLNFSFLLVKKKSGAEFRKAREIRTNRVGLGTKVEKKHGDQDVT